MPNSAFCYEHSLSCSRISPLTGWEPKYEPERWNIKNEIRETHNCFSYAMNVHDPKQIEACKKSKPSKAMNAKTKKLPVPGPIKPS